MGTLRILLLLAWVVVFFAGRIAWQTSTAVSELGAVSDRERRTPTVRILTPPEPRRDLRGNPVEEAIGDYRLDPRGRMYERHAPDTALLELSPPEV